MGKNKLKKFAEMETLPCVYQYPYSEIRNSITTHRSPSSSDVARANMPSGWDVSIPNEIS